MTNSNSETQMDAALAWVADQYEAARAAGEKRIRARWRFLYKSTQQTLVRSGFYSVRAERLKVEPYSADGPRNDIERLEYALGVFDLCKTAKLPSRGEKEAKIPFEATTDDVLTQCDELLFVPAWYDPEFLALALVALARHQEANALSNLGPERPPKPLPLVVLGAVFEAVMVIMIPASIAYGLVAALSRETWAAIVAFYMAGGGVISAIGLKSMEKGKPLTKFERAYLGWSQFHYLNIGCFIGSGARVNLERMAQEGVTVPSVAFDLCALLLAQAQAAAAGAQRGSSPTEVVVNQRE